MEQQHITYLGSVPYMPMRQPQMEAYKYRELGEILQDNVKALGGSLDQYAKYKEQEGKIQDIKSGLDFENQANDIIGSYRMKCAAEPMAYDKHRQWAQSTMNDIGKLNYSFSDDLSQARFDSRKRGLITDFNVSNETRISQSRLGDAEQVWKSSIERAMKEGRYTDAKGILQSGANTFAPAGLVENEIAGVDRVAVASIAQRDILSDPNDALRKLGSGHYVGLGEDDTYNLSQEAKKALNKKRAENGEMILGLQLEGKVISEETTREMFKKGYLSRQQAEMLMSNEKARIKGIKPVYDADTYGMLDGLISDYKPEDDMNGDKAGDVLNEIAVSNLPDSYKKKLQERFKEKGDSVNDAEKRHSVHMNDFARKEINRLFDTGVLGNFKDNMELFTINENGVGLDTSYKSSPEYEKAIVKQSQLIEEAENFIKTNPKASQPEVKDFIGKRSDEIKAKKSIDISTKKDPVPFAGNKPASGARGFSLEESGAALRDAMGNLDMSAPKSRIPGMMDIILSQEVRRDKNGKLVVYNLPATDGGGRYEVAGLNEVHNPKEAAELKGLVESGKHEEAEKKSREYTEKLTRQPAEIMKTAGIKSAPVETFLRDTFHNMGEGGMARVVQRATGSQSSNRMDEATVKALGDLVKSKGSVGAIDALDKARQEHYQAIADSNPGKKMFLNGWLARSKRVAGLAKNVAGYDYKDTDWESVRAGLIAESAKIKVPISQFRIALGKARQDWLYANSSSNI